MGSLGLFLDGRHVGLLVVRQEVVDAGGIDGCDGVLLRCTEGSDHVVPMETLDASTNLSQVVLDDDGIGELEQTRGVAVQVLPLLLAQSVEVELTDLSVLAVGTFVPPV